MRHALMIGLLALTVAVAVKLIGPAYDAAVAAGTNLPLEVQAVVNAKK